MNQETKPVTWLSDPRRGRPCTIIGEVAQAHDGSLGQAHAFIDAIADAGADAVKFQTHIASAESTPGEPWRKKFSPQDDTRYDYWKRMEFTEPQWHALKKHATERGLLFLSSPFSPQAVELLKRVGVAGWKVASGEVSNLDLIDAMAATGQPVMLSSGMSGMAELDEAVAVVKKRGAPLAVMQCSTMYPTSPEAVGLNVMAAFRERYGCAVGLSDHSAKIFPGLAAATLGAEVFELHVALSRHMFGPDTIASVTPEELKQLVEGVRFIERMRAAPIDKDQSARDLAAMRGIFTKSVVAVGDLAAGTVLEAQVLAAKKPGTGIPAKELKGLVGRRLKRAVKHDTPLSWDDLEPAA
ncbi:N-acetylneuraminate synthase [Vineibacter terrae]|uniref:N-acetylneuraminate synthase n=1 Tax=Vineibacter terrae TaxID=2586908 RepID=A0A5C8PPF8_9HYPH|nr:N-acetylneuraminate synthase [Vineibacter terrae]